MCLLVKLPEEKLSEIEAMVDYWNKRVATERELRSYQHFRQEEK